MVREVGHEETKDGNATVTAGNAPNEATGGITAIVRGRTGPAACAWGRTVFVGP